MNHLLVVVEYVFFLFLLFYLDILVLSVISPSVFVHILLVKVRFVLLLSRLLIQHFVDLFVVLLINLTTNKWFSLKIRLEIQSTILALGPFFLFFRFFEDGFLSGSFDVGTLLPTTSDCSSEETITNSDVIILSVSLSLFLSSSATFVALNWSNKDKDMSYNQRNFTWK